MCRAVTAPLQKIYHNQNLKTLLIRQDNYEYATPNKYLFKKIGKRKNEVINMMAQRAPRVNNIRSQNIKTLLLRQAVFIYTVPIKYLFYKFGDYLITCGGLKLLPTEVYTPYYLFFTYLCPNCGIRFRFPDPPWYCSVCNEFVTKPQAIYYIALLTNEKHYGQKVPKDKIKVLKLNGKPYFYAFEMGDRVECAGIY